jgi:hypothetical protein
LIQIKLASSAGISRRSVCSFLPTIAQRNFIVSIPQATAASFPRKEALLIACRRGDLDAASRGHAWPFLCRRPPDGEFSEGGGMELQLRDGDEQFS